MVELLLAEEKQPGVRGAELQAAVREAVALVVSKQVECGLDIINDGEQGRTDYTVHVMRRLTGYDGPSAPPMGTGDEEFPELAAQLKFFASPFQHRPACSGPVDWKDWPAAQADIDLAKRAMQGAKAEDIFMTSPSPGQIARYLKNRYYKNDEDYIFALADVMRRDTGPSSRPASFCSWIVPISQCCGTWSTSTCRSPITARSSPPMFPRSIMQCAIFLPKGCACMCAGARPWRRTTPMLSLKTSSTSCSRRARMRSRSLLPTPRHEHEWKIWREVKLPAGKKIIPGVIDSTSNIVEHPEVVADRIMNFASVVGRENMIAGVDCGFGTFAGRVQVDTKIVWLKLQALTEGARRASKQLWAKAA